MDDQELLAALSKDPAVRERIESLLSIAMDKEGAINLANDAEALILAAGRNLNREILKAWAVTKEQQAGVHFKKKHKRVRKDVKKN